MEFHIDPSAWRAVFPVPSSVVDKHIKLAGAVQLKALLWLFRHASDDKSMEEMSDDLGVSVPDAADALQYWAQAGILVKQGQAVRFVPAAALADEDAEKEQKLAEPPKMLPAIEFHKPTIEQIAVRGEESPEIRYMFTEVQQKLGRTIGHDGQAVLLMMHDQYGLPVEVILMIIEYCVSVEKTSFSYIAKMGQDWGEKEIDTIVKADEQISALRLSNDLWSELRTRAGFVNPRPTASQMKYLNLWKNELGYDIDMIYLAYEQMAENTQKLSFPYINKVLLNWHKKGLKTPGDVEDEHKTRIQAKAGQKKDSKKTASYDIDEFKKQALKKPLVYQRKGEGE